MDSKQFNYRNIKEPFTVVLWGLPVTGNTSPEYRNRFTSSLVSYAPCSSILQTENSFNHSTVGPCTLAFYVITIAPSLAVLSNEGILFSARHEMNHIIDVFQ